MRSPSNSSLPSKSSGMSNNKSNKSKGVVAQAKESGAAIWEIDDSDSDSSEPVEERRHPPALQPLVVVPPIVVSNGISPPKPLSSGINGRTLSYARPNASVRFLDC